jgi:hypothetical protein
MIAVVLNDAASFEGLAIGQEIVIKGERDCFLKENNVGKIAGQTCISKATIEANYYGDNQYYNGLAVTNKTVSDIYNADPNVDYTTTLYHVTATVVIEETQRYTNIYISDGKVNLRLYSSSANQYNWLKAYAGKTITVEIAPCNWNDKNYYTGCVLAVILDNGDRICNTLNFDTYNK